jgi:multiple sugar transport system substrate-binding protein
MVSGCFVGRKGRVMRLRSSALSALLGLVLLAVACTAGGGNQATAPPTINPSTSHEPVTITFWTGWGADTHEFPSLEKVLKGFEQKYPWITVKAVPGVDDDAKIFAAINAGNPPDAVASFRPDYIGKYCSTDAFLDLGPYLQQSKISTDIFPPSILNYIPYKGEICALPLLTDTFGLYYNKDLLAKAGITEPPKTMSELADMAKRLTERNPDGSIKVAGFVPFIGNFYENDLSRFAVPFGAKYFDDAGKSAYASDPAWTSLFQWQKSLVDFYGYRNLTKFLAGAGDEWDSSNAFEQGKVALHLDGEWRTAFIADEAPDLNYGTASFPAADDHPEMYGAQVIGGTIIGIPRGSEHPAEAWLLVSYLSTNTDALVEFANAIHNVPTTIEALNSPNLDLGANFDAFLQALQNSQSGFPPQTSAGTIQNDLGNEFAGKWQAGKIPDLVKGLQDLDTQVNDQLSLGG